MKNLSINDSEAATSVANENMAASSNDKRNNDADANETAELFAKKCKLDPQNTYDYGLMQVLLIEG